MIAVHAEQQREVEDAVAAGEGADDAGELYYAEKTLSNGDYYSGQWAGNLHHGHGKYLWTDGCMYIGEWRKGKTMGRGKFCWPSGATYEGNFRNGYMDGRGTYTGPAGDTYNGTWLMNLNHGHGTKSYVNGDLYEGEWKGGLQDGNGRYQWKNGNHYVGQWKRGTIHGSGSMVWSNGNRYDGEWKDGLPDGNGTFRWADGSFYIGIWSRDKREQRGTYYPPSIAATSVTGARLELDPEKLLALDLREFKTSTAEKPPLTLQKMQQQKPKKVIADGRVYNYSWGSDGTSDSGERSRPTRQQPLIKPVKRLQGEAISKGHKNYDLMLNLQLGIRYLVAKSGPATAFDLKPSAFDPKEKVWTKFPPEGSKHTPPHQSCEFKWKDYCPLVFRTLRKLFKVNADDYMLSLCSEDAFRELSSPGRSGSTFYMTHDDRYMIKTIKKAETKVSVMWCSLAPIS
ncbi:hypothetical protein SAY86_010926 [Trapa natans]|uniref:1-phosphatidylinositol-4-phosphate 5-kinase n=1 Tax=Trapa natans TaxID=22666 RepID=A0AAN7LFJ0_TRANT|nr:hypothetical protein SAY86_010926 [Trapa natans]